VYFFVKPNESGICPICSDELTVRGLRQRKLKNEAEKWEIYIIRRMYCGKCRRIHHELPDLIVPYKRHCAATIENIIGNKSEETLCDNRTITRILSWWKIVLPYFMNILQSLASKHRTTFPGAPSFKEIVRAAVNSNNWKSAKRNLYPFGLYVRVNG